MVLVAFSVFAGFAVLEIVVCKAMRLPLHSFLPSLMFPDTGNMGLPLALFAFGQGGLGLAIVFLVVSITLQFTIGIPLGVSPCQLHVRSLGRAAILSVVRLGGGFLIG